MRALSLPPAASAIIKVHVRTPNEKKTIDTQQTAKIKDFKEAVSSAFGVTVSRLCLLYGGKTLGDNEALNTLGITHDKLVHLVIKKKGAASASQVMQSFSC